MKQCAICDRFTENENASILTMGAYGVPKYLCDECAADIDAATLSHNYEEAAAAIERLGTRVADCDPDGLTFKNVSAILASAADRAKQIKAGTYDFSLDEAEDDNAFDEIPEELQASDDDAELDAIDEEKQKKFDKVFNWIAIGAIAAALIYVLWRVLDAYVF